MTIAENLQALRATKVAIKNAIEEKGQDLTNVRFTEFAEKITAISGGKKFTTGTITFSSASGNQVITHNLGSIPSIFLMIAKQKSNGKSLIFDSDTTISEPNGAYGFAWFKEYDLMNYFNGAINAANAGLSIEWRNTGSFSLTWIVNTIALSQNDLPTATTITTGYRNGNYLYLPDIEYEWIAIE